MEEIKSAGEIRDIANSFRESRILLSAFELGIFTVLDKHMMSAEDVSEKINSDPKAASRLMNALCAMGLLKKVKGKFYNTDIASKCLVEGKPDFMGALYHTNHLWDTWTFLTESVIKGSSHKGDQNKIEKTEWVEAFIGAMHYRGVHQAKIIAMMIDIAGVNKILDVGGGSAAFSMELVRKNPGSSAVVLDLPHVIPLTRKYVEEAGLSDKINFIEGNYLDNDFEDNYDLILLSAIVHINSYDQNKKLIQKCAHALNEKGMIIISDFIMSEDRVHPGFGAFFSLNMLVGTEEGDTYTESEMREWFEAAGISDIERKNTSFGSDLLIGKK